MRQWKSEVYQNTWAMGDWSGHGRIDGGDPAIWSQDDDPFDGAETSGFPAIPESATLLRLGSGSLLMALRRRRRGGQAEDTR
jgi:hypothetical protein